MFTRRIYQIRAIQEFEKDLPEWERQNYVAMDREDREMYLRYLRSMPKGKKATTNTNNY